MELKSRTNQPVEGNIEDDVLDITQNAVVDGQLLGYGAIGYVGEDLGDAQDVEEEVLMPRNTINQPSENQLVHSKRALLNAVKRGYIKTSGYYLSLVLTDVTEIKDEMCAIFGITGEDMGCKYEIWIDDNHDASSLISVTYTEL